MQPFSNESEPGLPFLDGPFLDKDKKVPKVKIPLINIKCKYCGKDFLKSMKGWPYSLKNHEDSCNYNYQQKNVVEKKTKSISSKSRVGNSDQPFHDECEFCEKRFDTKSNLGLKKRFHIYSHHFHKEINDDIDWKSSGTVCPAKNCTHSAKTRGNLIIHYIGSTHGILDKYIDAKRKRMNKQNKASIDDSGKNCTMAEDTITEVKTNGIQDATDHDLSLKPEELINEPMTEVRFDNKCDLCGKSFTKAYSLKRHAWNVHGIVENVKIEEHNKEIIDKENTTNSNANQDKIEEDREIIENDKENTKNSNANQDETDNDSDFRPEASINDTVSQNLHESAN